MIAVPMGIGAEFRADSSVTSFKVSGGGGSYVRIIRDCEGNPIETHRHEFQDIGVEISHKFRTPQAIGVRGGYLEDHRRFVDFSDPNADAEKGLYYVNPYVSVEARRFGIGGGAAFTTRKLYGGGVAGSTDSKVYPTLHLRIGAYERTYFSTSWLENLPIYSGGGDFDMGLGTRITPEFGWWWGLSAGGTYDRPGALLKLDYLVHPSWRIHTNLRWGRSESNNEYGAGIGLTYDWIHR
ncbi:MAG: hypothetical protein V3V49_06090 [Candidatus Krumholzibacteria bacterium]